MRDDAAERKTIVAQCKNGLCAGTYVIDGQKLKIGSAFGAQSTILGLQKPDKLARKLLKHLCDASSTGPDDTRLLKKRPRTKKPACVACMGSEPRMEGASESPPTSVDGPGPLKGEAISA